MEFAVLGPLLVRRETGTVSLGGTKQRAVLALLLLEANRVVPRERLIDGLWGDNPPETATQTVQVYISRLRKVLPAGMLLTRSPGYLLEIDPELIDAHRFTRLVGDARLVPSAQAAQLLREALDLWRGPALAEFDDEPILRLERARLEEARLVALEHRLEIDLAIGRHAELVGELEALVAQHPHREQFSAQLMLSLYRAGRQAEALAVYRRVRAALVGDLGLEPGQALQELEQAILCHDRSLDLARAAASAEDRETAAREASPIVDVVPARKIVTVVFCEPVASTMTGEPLDTEAFRVVMSRYFEATRVVMQRHGGFVESLLSDAVMTLFGLPLVHEDDAIRALRAAVELRAAISELSRSLERDFRMTLDVRIGINTGEVITGPGGRPATGEVLSTAARMQPTAVPGEILIADETLALVRDSVDVEALGRGVYRVTRFEPWAPRGSGRLGTPMVGRSRELERLRDALATAVEGRRCVACTLVGAPGVGKSRLAREFVSAVDAQVLEGRCFPYGEGITYSAVVDVVNQLGGRHRELLADLPSAVDAIASLLGESQASTAPEEIAWSIRKLLEATGRERPVIVVFDDVQWGESAFVELIQQIGYLSTGAPIMVLCLARPELFERHPDWGAGNGDAITISLEPLAADEVDELIDHLLQGAQLEDELGARIRAAAGGNPLFVEEMVAFLREAHGEMLVPPTINALLAARLDQLEPAERELLGYGSIEGELFHRGAVEALATAPHEVDREVAALVRKQLLQPDRSPILRDDAYRFRHLLIRDTAYDSLPKARRAELHERYAGWLADHADQPAERDELLGYHLEQAHRHRAALGNPDDALGERAAAHLAAAGRRAARRSDFSASASLLERAIALGGYEPRERLELQLELGRAFGATRRIAEAETLLAAVADEATAVGEAAMASVARVLTMWNRTGEVGLPSGEMFAVADEAIQTLTRAADDAGLVPARRLRGLALSGVGDAVAAGIELERALVHAEASGDKELRRGAMNTYMNAFLVPGPTHAAAAIARCEEFLQRAEDDRILTATIKRPLSVFCAMVGRGAEALVLIEEAAAVLDELNLRNVQVYRPHVAYARELAGDLAGAERELVAMWRYFDDLRRGDNRGMQAAAELARLYCNQRRWDEAEAAIRDVPSVAYRFNPTAGMRRQAVEARLLSWRGHHDEAVALATHIVEDAETHGHYLELQAALWAAAGEVFVAAGDASRGEAAIARALEYHRRKGNVVAVARLTAAVTA